MESSGFAAHTAYDAGGLLPEVSCENISLSSDDSAVDIIDQTQLPNRLVHLGLSTSEECYEAIATLAVRGAPAIGIFAGYAFYVLARQAPYDGFGMFRAAMVEVSDHLVSSRPTAVNLKVALDRMMRVVDAHPAAARVEMLAALRAEACSIQAEDAQMCFRMAELGLRLLRDGSGIITHCNAGPLATSRYGTALGPILLGRERGMHFKVFADETRPLLQGARLTSYELDRAGVDVTLICDNMASIVMSQHKVQACFVGCDRVAANGDTANKIGTSGLAIVAAYYGVPFYVMCPTTTIDLECATGDDIPIELRRGDEIKTMFYQQPMAPAEVKCYNPSFDVTDHTLITAIVTERGVCRPPYTDSLPALF